MKDINLMPREYIILEKRRKLGIFIFILIIIVLAFMAVLVMAPIRIINQKKQTLAQLNAELKNPKYEIIDELKVELSQKQDEKTLLNNLISQVDYNTIASRTTLDILTGHLPPDMYISSITVNNEYIKSSNVKNEYPYIRIKGAANSFRAISDYSGQLLNVPFIRDVVINTTAESTAKDGISADHIKYDIILYVDKTKGSVNHNEE
ncbi:MAG: PilN domain-containing protein [Epulopiscium sp.]|nr:PilN domain-containing protein [Candidatus Epulonipiscium sp.]